MKITNYVSEKAIKHLQKIDLKKEAEELQNIRENLSEDLKYWLIHAIPDTHYSELLSLVKRMVDVIYVNGNSFMPKSTATTLKKSFTEFITANKDILIKEFACALCPLSASVLKADRLDPAFFLLFARKLCHKAWLHSEWKGVSFGKDFWEFAKRECSNLEVKKNTFIPAYYKGDTFRKKNSCMFHDCEAQGKHLIRNKTNCFELDILNIGVGRLKVNESMIPVIMPNIPKSTLYLALQRTGTDKKYIAMFPDFSVLSLQKKLKVTDWKVYASLGQGSVPNFILSGTDYDKKIQIELFGTVPFIMPMPK